jgi:hypothetical protein
MKKHVSVIALAFVSTLASADCFVRVSTNLTQKALDHGPVDYQQLVTPDARGFKCVMRYRVNIRDEWQTAEGEGVGKTEEEACAQAQDLKRGSLLKEVTSNQIRADSQMICSDIPEIRVRRVRTGERIWESEVDLHTVASQRRYFSFKNTQCRMFVERSGGGGNLFTHQGVICKETDQKNSKWLVVDKY